jgi:hypothetical protein
MKHYLLSEVARLLGCKQHHITYAITTKKVAEPETRVAGRRLFSAEDVVRIGKHLRVSPNWDALNPPRADDDTDRPVHLTLRPPFEVCQVGETGHEVRDGDGEVFAWASDRARAMVLAGLLESAARG